MVAVTRTGNTSSQQQLLRASNCVSNALHRRFDDRSPFCRPVLCYMLGLTLAQVVDGIPLLIATHFSRRSAFRQLEKATHTRQEQRSKKFTMVDAKPPAVDLASLKLIT